MLSSASLHWNGVRAATLRLSVNTREIIYALFEAIGYYRVRI